MSRSLPGLQNKDPSGILERLGHLFPGSIDLSLHRITSLLSDLGNPHRRMPPVIHVAGTNGKGSTIAFLRAILEASGHSVHVYTSPHLVQFNERIRLAGEPIADEALVELLDEVELVNAGRPITFFEATTAAAFLAFSRKKADYTIIEAGMGGRLDATNVMPRPAVTAITPISSITPSISASRLLRSRSRRPAFSAATYRQPSGRNAPRLQPRLRSPLIPSIRRALQPARIGRSRFSTIASSIRETISSFCRGRFWPATIRSKTRDWRSRSWICSPIFALVRPTTCAVS